MFIPEISKIVSSIEEQVALFKSESIMEIPRFVTTSGYKFANFCFIAKTMGYVIYRHRMGEDEFCNYVHVMFREKGGKSRQVLFTCVLIEDKKGGE